MKDAHAAILETKSSFWTKSVYDDGSFIMIQDVLPKGVDKTIVFGPLRTTLTNMFVLRFHIQVDGFINKSYQTIRLVRMDERYKLARVKTERLSMHSDLSALIKDVVRPHYEMSIVSKQAEAKPVDPFEQLQALYPVKKNPIEFVGNQTLRQYVSQQLKEQRKLQHVR